MRGVDRNATRLLQHFNDYLGIAYPLPELDLTAAILSPWGGGTTSGSTKVSPAECRRPTLVPPRSTLHLLPHTTCT
jgi:hypothetical protein